MTGCALDLATKTWIFNEFGGPRESPTWWLWTDVFGFQTSLNEGALFGMGQGRVVLFAGLSILVVPCVLYWLFVVGAARDLLLTVALGLVTAGILGNLYDRLGLPGLAWRDPWIVGGLHQAGEPVYAVRDWILVMIGTWPWPTFNIADSLLVCRRDPARMARPLVPARETVRPRQRFGRCRVGVGSQHRAGDRVDWADGLAGAKRGVDAILVRWYALDSKH